MNIEYYPKKEMVDCIKDSQSMIAIIDFEGENAIVAPYLEVETHNNLLRSAVTELGTIQKGNLDDYFLIYFDKDVSDWSFAVPENYCDIEDSDERAKQYYIDGFSVISKFFRDFDFLIGINIPKRFR